MPSFVLIGTVWVNSSTYNAFAGRGDSRNHRKRLHHSHRANRRGPSGPRRSAISAGQINMPSYRNTAMAPMPPASTARTESPGPRPCQATLRRVRYSSRRRSGCRPTQTAPSGRLSSLARTVLASPRFGAFRARLRFEGNDRHCSAAANSRLIDTRSHTGLGNDTSKTRPTETANFPSKPLRPTTRSAAPQAEPFPNSSTRRT